jgi:hypothetical protein
MRYMTMNQMDEKTYRGKAETARRFELWKIRTHGILVLRRLFGHGGHVIDAIWFIVIVYRCKAISRARRANCACLCVPGAEGGGFPTADHTERKDSGGRWRCGDLARKCRGGANGFSNFARMLRGCGLKFTVIDHRFWIELFHGLWFFHRFLLAPGQQLLESTLARIRLVILAFRWCILVLLFGTIDVLAGMAEARLVITLITLHKDERTGLFARLEEFRKGDIDIG